MLKKFSVTNLVKVAAGLCTAGMLFAASCAADDVRALMIGVDAAARYLDNGSTDDDISFSDWLMDELGDL